MPPEGYSRFPLAEMRRARRAGVPNRVIATRYGCTRVYAWMVTREVHPRRRYNDPAAFEIVPQPAEPNIPTWVAAADLVEDYRDLAAEFDEYYAARQCRRLKAEALQ